jgi:hypothetical protein
MIRFNFDIANPFSKRWNNCKSIHGHLTKNKNWEIELLQDNSIISIEFNLSFWTNHAGINIGFGLLGYTINVAIYDNRHWNTDTKNWVKHE